MTRKTLAFIVATGIALGMSPLAPARATAGQFELLVWVYTTSGISPIYRLGTFTSIQACNATATAVLKPRADDIGPTSAVRVRCVPAVQ